MTSLPSPELWLMWKGAKEQTAPCLPASRGQWWVPRLSVQSGETPPHLTVVTVASQGPGAHCSKVRAARSADQDKQSASGSAQRSSTESSEEGGEFPSLPNHHIITTCFYTHLSSSLIFSQAMYTLLLNQRFYMH